MSYSHSNPKMMERYQRIAEMAKKTPSNTERVMKRLGILKQMESVAVALPSEIDEEKKLTLVSNDDESIIDEGQDATVISASLARMVKDSTRARYVMSEESLTAREREDLAKDLAEYRKTHPLWIVLFNPNPFEWMKKAVPTDAPQTVKA